MIWKYIRICSAQNGNFLINKKNFSQNVLWREITRKFYFIKIINFNMIFWEANFFFWNVLANILKLNSSLPQSWQPYFVIIRFNFLENKFGIPIGFHCADKYIMRFIPSLIFTCEGLFSLHRLFSNFNRIKLCLSFWCFPL